MAVVPPGKGNTAEGRPLREHARMVTEQFQRAGVEITELHQLLIVRLGRMALQLSLLERRMDAEGLLSEYEARQYHSLSNQYFAALKEIALRPPRGRDQRSDRPWEETVADLLRETE